MSQSSKSDPPADSSKQAPPNKFDKDKQATTPPVTSTARPSTPPVAYFKTGHLLHTPLTQSYLAAMPEYYRELMLKFIESEPPVDPPSVTRYEGSLQETFIKHGNKPFTPPPRVSPAPASETNSDSPPTLPYMYGSDWPPSPAGPPPPPQYNGWQQQPPQMGYPGQYYGPDYYPQEPCGYGFPGSSYQPPPMQRAASMSQPSLVQRQGRAPPIVMRPSCGHPGCRTIYFP